MRKPSLDLNAHDERLQTTLARRHEAVVVTDAAAQALTGWEPTAAQGRAVAEVVQVVAGGATLLPPSGAVGMAWPTDQSVELAGHYLWRGTDSTVLPLAGGTTPLRDGAGHLLFQTLASLLDLQADALEDPRALAALEDSQQRLQAMALVHQSLAHSRDLDWLDGAAYLRGLATALGRAYAAEARQVALTITAEAVWVRAETAIPCGLILHELLTNALKHAFPAGRPGAIAVTLRAEPVGTWVLHVRDDGVGFPAGLDFCQTDSLGLQLVCLLTEQLRGTLEMTSGPGTRWRLTLPVASVQARGEDEGPSPDPPH
jgi:two-component sensor histidine kinase